MIKEKEGSGIVFSKGDIPVLKVEGKTLPEAWERSLQEVWQNGVAIKLNMTGRRTLPAGTAVW
ncbi:MAG: hypothetical protein L0956_04740 [Candidatus Mariimomonas ferrooxydans]